MENKKVSEIVEGGELYHYGVLGMRWGFRRYQPYSLIPRKSGKGGKETGAAKKASKASASKSSSTKSRNQRSADAAKAREVEAKTARERKEQAEKIVRSGNINLVYQHRKELSEKQLKEAISRIDTEKKVAELYRNANPSTLQKAANTAKKLKDLNDGFDQVARAYNNVARTVNMATGEDTGETLRYIKDASTKGKNPRKLKDKVKDGSANKGNGEHKVNKPNHKLRKSNH